MMAFDFTPLLPADLPPPAARWTGLPRYNFTGGNNDPDAVPVEALTAAAQAVLTREGRDLSHYGLRSGPQGYRPLREFLVGKLKRDAGIACGADDILLVSGSLQALDLVNGALLATRRHGDRRKGQLPGHADAAQAAGRDAVGIPLDEGGMRMDALAAALKELKARGVRPKFIYTIPTVQNPTGTILSVERREALLKLAEEYGVPVFEDDCYSDLIWSGERPPALYAMSKSRERHPYRLVLQVGRAGLARRLHRRALGDPVAHAAAEDRRRLGRARADGAGRILRAAFQRDMCRACGARSRPSSTR